jgi:Fur family transcriptional regulator, zinc uptake regulator
MRAAALLSYMPRGGLTKAHMSNELFPEPGHDHGPCIDEAVARAKRVCEAGGIRLTALREAVLRVLTGSHKALGAYDIIERMSEQGRRLAPISVYRIIDVLIEAGLVHRLESRNAYFACLAPHQDSASMVVLLCQACDRVAEAEAPAAWGAINAITKDTGFAVSATILEIQGQCPDCRKPPQQAA